MNISTVKLAQWDKTQSRDLLGLFICVCIALCTIVAHNIAQNRRDNFPSYPSGNHHCSDDVCLREGGWYSWRCTSNCWRQAVSDSRCAGGAIQSLKIPYTMFVVATPTIIPAGCMIGVLWRAWDRQGACLSSSACGVEWLTVTAVSTSTACDQATGSIWNPEDRRRRRRRPITHQLRPGTSLNKWCSWSLLGVYTAQRAVKTYRPPSYVYNFHDRLGTKQLANVFSCVLSYICGWKQKGGWRYDRLSSLHLKIPSNVDISA